MFFLMLSFNTFHPKLLNFAVLHLSNPQMKKYILTYMFFMASFSFPLVHAREIEVKHDPKIIGVIQNAIDLASDGDIIRVSPGNYDENLNFGNKDIKVQSTDGPSKTLIQAADKMNSVVIMNGGTLHGFTLTGGTGTPKKSSYGSDYYGGGVHASGNSVIENCIIHGNGQGVDRKNAGTFAGGVYAGGRNSKVILRNSLIYNNYAWACGGAVLSDHRASVKIENCTIFGNKSTSFFGLQGGVGMANGGQVEIFNSIVWGNTGEEIGAFSGIYANGTQATVSHSFIQGGYPGVGNLTGSNPGFKKENDPFGADRILGTSDDGLRLDQNSPAIDQANSKIALRVSEFDVANFLRRQGKNMDMGCYEFGESRATQSKEKKLFALGLVPIEPADPISIGYPKYPEIKVQIPKFLIGVHEVTFQTWTEVRMAAKSQLGWDLNPGTQGSGYQDTNQRHPVAHINFLDVALWCNALSLLSQSQPCYMIEDTNGNKQVFEPAYLSDAKKRGIFIEWGANGMRVPTGNEWEAAARGGLLEKKYPWGNEYPGKVLANWYVGSGMPNSSTEVGSYQPNTYGLFDMAGGVNEFVWDDQLKPSAIRIDQIKNRLTIRGGTWNAGWAPEVTHGWEIGLTWTGTAGFRLAQTQFLPNRGAPALKEPNEVPGGFVNYISKWEEVKRELGKKEQELLKLLKQGEGREKTLDDLKAELVKLEKEYKAAEAGLRACEEEGVRIRSEIANADKQILSRELQLIVLGGELEGARKRLKDADCERQKIEERMEHLREEIKDSPNKLKTAHTPGWHYAPGYGWLWTSPKHYPQIYSNARQGWVYYEQGTMEPWLYYDYQLEQWEEWFLDAPLFSSSN